MEQCQIDKQIRQDLDAASARELFETKMAQRRLDAKSQREYSKMKRKDRDFMEESRRVSEAMVAQSKRAYSDTVAARGELPSAHMENPYIGRDGRDYHTPEALREADEEWVRRNFSNPNPDNLPEYLPKEPIDKTILF